MNNPEAVYLKCVADGNPPPKYKWNSPLRHVVGALSRYAVQQPHREHFGKYICEADNGIGFARHDVELIQIGKGTVNFKCLLEQFLFEKSKIPKMYESSEEQEPT